MNISVQMHLAKTTKGALRYEEREFSEGKPYQIGTLYVRKSAMPTPPPTTITVSVGANEGGV